MSFYPILLELHGKPCLVVGGGRIAARKTVSLLRAGAVVTIVAPECCRQVQRLEPFVTIVNAPFDATVVAQGLTLVIGATNSNEVNRAVFAIASQRNIPCNIVDCPDLCSFIVPAVVSRGDITIAIATGGKSPRLSRYLKEKVAQCIGPDYTELAAYMAVVRTRIRALIAKQRVRAAFWEALFAVDPVDFIARNGWIEFDSRTQVLIDEYSHKTDIS